MNTALPLISFGVLRTNVEGAPTSVAEPVHVPAFEPEPEPEPDPDPPSGCVTFEASIGLPLPSTPSRPPVPTALPSLVEQLARKAAPAAPRLANAQTSRRDRSTRPGALLIAGDETASAVDLSRAPPSQ